VADPDITKESAPPHEEENDSKTEDFTKEPEPASPPVSGAAVLTKPYNPDETRETTRGDLARGLLWLLTFAIGGVIVFIGLGRLDGTVLTQSVFPSLVALAGTALGFYFGSQTAKESAKEPDSSAGSGTAGGGAAQQKAGGQGN
jgi:hypothetical protein